MQPSRTDIWKQGWMLPWLAVAVLWLADAGTGLLQPLDRWWSDRVLATTPRAISSEIALVAIDDASLARLGHWPWSRELHARVIDRLTEVGAGVVAYTVPFVGAEGEDALSQLQRIADTVASDPSLADHPRLTGLLVQSQDLLDADTRLARSLSQSRRCLLSVDNGLDGSGPATWPLTLLSAAALGVAPIGIHPGGDGLLRRVALTQSVDGRVLPSMAAWAVQASRGRSPAQVLWRPGQSKATVGERVLSTDRQGMIRPLWRDSAAPGPQFVRVSAADLLKGTGPEPRLAGKMVFVGVTATGVGLPHPLVDGGVLFPVEVVAQMASALLTGHVVQTPPWTALATASLMLAVVFCMVLVLPRLALVTGLIVSLLAAASVLVLGQLLLSLGRFQLPVALPVAAIVLGSTVWLVVRQWQAYRARVDDKAGSFLNTRSGQGAGGRAESSLTLSPALPRLGRFQIVRELARGAMGRVYVAHELETLRPVALKTLALSREFEGATLQEARDRFQREALAASRLHHPDIVRVIDAGEDQGLAYIAMELLGGHDLVRHTRAHDLLPVPVVLELTARIAEALHHAHEHGVIHRDIKPANLMVNPAQGMVKITDFGIARVIDAARTRTGVILGSPSYMSPEQLVGRAIDGRSDLFSLGVVLFQLLTGALPAHGETMAKLLDAVVNQPAPDVRNLRPRLPEAVANIVALALEKRPELRYIDCHQMAADLRAVASLWRQATGRAPHASAGSWASPSEFVEAMDMAL